MSSARDIPQRKHPLAISVPVGGGSASSSPRSLGSSISSSTGTPVLSSKGKQRASDSPGFPASPSSPQLYFSSRRSTMLGCSLAEPKYTVINLSHHANGPPRLVTCVKSSQGFDWNQELFLPSYANYTHHDLEHRPDPVEDIILTDEEAAAILPQ